MSSLANEHRAAILLLGVGEEAAAALMKHMAPKEVQRVGEAMSTLVDVSTEQMVSVMQAFSEDLMKVSPVGLGASEFTQRVMVQALGENRARSMINKITKGGTHKWIDALKWLDAPAVVDLVMDEHPQITAIILASLDGELAAQVLELLPAERARDVMLRIARLDEVDSQALEELDRVLEKQLGKKQKAPPKSVDGMTSAAAILNHMGSALEAEILESIIEADGELGEKIHDLMFVFEDLLEVDDRGMQRLLRDVAGDSLVVALKGVDDQLKDKFFRNMSSRAAEMLMEDLEAAGPVKLSEVETAQKDILAVATKLSEEGEIFLGKGDGEYV